ncbi:hypothetical protein GCM10010124_39350 [Pilimelia terevasa]|uniref:DUF58 domain-containing protein n=1 Tax=Pilimelia terevasa TaxID=53372 RepID=A0A8J3BTT5_9ACTN|nr:DUF58 domain-containing protein [Pilimelia terevasa]GGK42631.1 hypothetical protein GCM10010124_39350 [Pilimelia terevasa]
MRLTARGAGLAAAAAAALLAGWWGRYPELLLLGGVAAAALGYALLHCGARPAVAVDRRLAPPRVARGEPCRVTLRVTNTSGWRGAHLSAADRCGPRRTPVAVRGLRPGASAEVGYDVPTGRRGVVGVGPLLVRRRDPFDLVSADRAHGGTARVWVYPRRYPLADVPPGATRSLDGRHDRVPHGSITFDSLRGYVVGDDLRRVHWRASARAGELLVREQVDTSVPHVVVVLDDRAEGYARAEDFESAVEVAASVVTAACQAHLPATLRLVGGAAADSGPRRAAAVGPYLELLTEATPRSGDVGAAVHGLRALGYGDTLIFVTGGAGRAAAAEVAGLRGRYAAVRTVVCDGAGPAGPPAPGVVEARDGADFAARWPAVRW